MQIEVSSSYIFDSRTRSGVTHVSQEYHIVVDIFFMVRRAPARVPLFKHWLAPFRTIYPCLTYQSEALVMTSLIISYPMLPNGALSL